MADANKTAIQVQNQNIGGDNSSFAVLINGAASNTNFSIRTNRTVADSTNSATVTNNIRLGLAGDRSNVVVLDMGGMPVVNMGEPTMSHDAVTLGYLQTNVGTNGPFLPLSGGTVTGATTFGSAIYGINSLLLFSKDSAASERTDILLGNTSIVVEVQDTNEFTFSADGLDMGKHKITDLAAPTQTGDAVNLGYIQTNIGTGPFLPLSGGTMTGDITGPQSWGLRSGHATNYSRIAFGTNQLQIGIGTVPTINVSGQALSMLTHRIVSLGDPIGNTDAVNLKTLTERLGGPQTITGLPSGITTEIPGAGETSNLTANPDGSGEISGTAEILFNGTYSIMKIDLTKALSSGTGAYIGFGNGLVAGTTVAIRVYSNSGNYIRSTGGGGLDSLEIVGQFSTGTYYVMGPTLLVKRS